MRLHHLTITAFGPYADTVGVDFDELNDAGIFLLTGPTGAGKTSILDAVCFALYGVVPGVRQVRTLRSDHAKPGVAPEVVLELSLGSRRFRVRRTPEWHRPKKRGDGMTKENASATLLELVDGEERLLSSRVAEVGHQLGELLQMSSDQFMQVVLLPQGEFQRFLRASSDERQEVLQRLFGTQRFEHVEHWIRDHSRRLAAGAEQAERRVAQLLATLANRAAATAAPALPDGLVQDRLGDVGSAARAWGAEVVRAAETGLAEAAAAEERTQEALAEAESESVEAERIATLVARRDRALVTLRALDADAVAADEAAAALHGHERARRVRPYLAPLTAAREAVAAASRRLEQATDALAGVVDLAAVAPTREGFATARDHVARRVAELRAALPRQHERHRVATRLSGTLAAQAAAEEELAALAARAETLPAQLEAVEQQLDDARKVAAVETAARRAVDEAAAVARAAAELPAVREEHRRLRELAQDARDRAADAREHHLDLVARRLAGMAVELAGTLVLGEPCQVCGAVDHPAPARPGADRVTEQDQQAAEAAYTTLRRHAEEATQTAFDAARRLHALEAAACGLGGEEAARQADAAQQTLHLARSAAARIPELTAQRDALQRESEELRRLRETSESARSTAAAEAAACARSLEALEAELRQLTGSSEESVEMLLDRHETAVGTFTAALDAFGALDGARARLDDIERAVEGAAQEHGFDSLDAAIEHLLHDAEAERLRRDLDERSQRKRAATAVLEEPEVTQLDATPARTPVAVRSALEAARAACRDASAHAGQVRAATEAVRRLSAELHEALELWEPARREHVTADGLSRLVRGMGSDNRLQMRLSSYVLATRLDQVLGAANERLGEMRDQRYTLRRTGKARGGIRAGLGLEVVDAWTGEARAPSTLSGGETFVVSLALALGLADVVSHESGGIRVDTLFVDEGFGMLDQDTLDDVMDRIDALRAGGRTVGVVSHVAELRARIPTQLHVESGRSGSSVAVRTLVP